MAPKWSPHGGPGGIQRTSFSLPKFNLGPLVRPKRRQSASRRYHKRFFAESEAEFVIGYSFLHCLLFDFFTNFPIKRYLVSEIGKTNICFKNHECIQKSNKESSQPYMKHNLETTLKLNFARLLHENISSIRFAGTVAASRAAPMDTIVCT